MQRDSKGRFVSRKQTTNKQRAFAFARVVALCVAFVILASACAVVALGAQQQTNKAHHSVTYCVFDDTRASIPCSTFVYNQVTHKDQVATHKRPVVKTVVRSQRHNKQTKHVARRIVACSTDSDCMRKNPSVSF